MTAKPQVNLVPNYDFEQHNGCPNGPDQIQKCTGWHKFSTIASTPDYYNSCATTGFFNVPFSGNGYQHDHRNCNAFAGLVTYGPTPNDREHIGIELSQPLTIGQKYFLSFYIVMAELIEPNGYRDGMPTDKIGIRLSTDSFAPNNPCPIDNFAHLHSANIINDSINWTRITGSIIADSAYNYIIIGNFFDDVSTDTLHFNCDSCSNSIGYYYVDDVCLSTDSLLCNGGIDSLSCATTGINELAFVSEASIFPNPTSELVKITFQENQDIDLKLIDFLGNIVLSTIFNKQDNTLDLSSVSSGCYLIKFTNKRTGTSILKKIIKI